MAIDLSTLRKGDIVTFDCGVRGIITVCYQNGSCYFVRWEFEPDRKKTWSGGDSWCCSTMWNKNGMMASSPGPFDIIDIIKPPLEELQDKITRLEQRLQNQDAGELRQNGLEEAMCELKRILDENNIAGRPTAYLEGVRRIITAYLGAP